MARAPGVLKRSQVIFSDFPGGQIQGSCCFSPSNCLHMMSKKSFSVASLLSGVYRWSVMQLLPTLNQGLVLPETLASLLLPGKNLDTPQFQKQWNPLLEAERKVHRLKTGLIGRSQMNNKFIIVWKCKSLSWLPWKRI